MKTRPPKILLVPFFSKKAYNLEFRINILLQILENQEDVHEIIMIFKAATVL